MRKQINPFIQPYASQPALFSLLDVSVGRLLRREGNPLAVDKEKLRHIADWLRAALVNDEPWLKNVDERGRPKKLMKFGSIDDIVREADKAMLKAAQKHHGVKLVDGDEAFHAEIYDGFYLVRLLRPAALDRESAQMQHCIGDGGYDEYLNDEGDLYLSLRDPQGKAHATMEIADGKIIQLQGKQNQPPIRKYLDLLVPYIRNSGLDVDLPATHLGHVVDVDGVWHPLENLPEGLTVGRSLDLSRTSISALPDRLTVSGDLILCRMPITKLPESLTVGGDLNLGGTPITELPNSLTVGRGLYLNSTNVVALPEGLSVGADLYLNCTPIAALPRGLTVEADLFLNDTKVTAFPDDLTVRGDLYLRHLHFTEIPPLPNSFEDCMEIYCSDGRISARDFRTTVMATRSSIAATPSLRTFGPR